MSPLSSGGQIMPTVRHEQQPMATAAQKPIQSVEHDGVAGSTPCPCHRLTNGCRPLKSIPALPPIGRT